MLFKLKSALKQSLKCESLKKKNQVVFKLQKSDTATNTKFEKLENLVIQTLSLPKNKLFSVIITK